MRSEVVRYSVGKSDSNLFIEGDLVIPKNPIGIIVFVHGSGSGKGSYRNQTVSKKLNDNNIATLLFDLLAEEEQESDRQLENIIYKIPGAFLNKFNISLLMDRLSMVTDWIMKYESLSNLKIGYFASSTGGAAALTCATKFPVKSIVIRSGRTDLVDNDLLSRIISPCLFIAGSKEKTLIKINRQTIKKLQNAEEKELSIVPNASHIFEEEGSLEMAANISTQWLKNHFIRLI